MNDWFEAAGAAAWGAVGFGGLASFMDRDALDRVEALCPGPTGVFVAAFPYYAGEAPGNLSQYARGMDYHQVVVDRLEQVCARLRVRWPGSRFVPTADNSPVPERPAALLAGLGVLGENGLVLTKPWGSYVFLGTILTDLDYPWPAPGPIQPCIRCGKCTAACPGGAIGGGGVDAEKCLSHLTQKKGALAPEQEALLARHPLIWGCDLCQQVCPYNREAPLTTIAEFREDLIDSLGAEELEGLTNREFREKYPGRAFTWRGVEVLRRNLRLGEAQGASGGSSFFSKKEDGKKDQGTATGL